MLFMGLTMKNRLDLSSRSMVSFFAGKLNDELDASVNAQLSAV